MPDEYLLKGKHAGVPGKKMRLLPK